MIHAVLSAANQVTLPAIASLTVVLLVVISAGSLGILQEIALSRKTPPKLVSSVGNRVICNGIAIKIEKEEGQMVVTIVVKLVIWLEIVPEGGLGLLGRNEVRLVRMMHVIGVEAKDIGRVSVLVEREILKLVSPAVGKAIFRGIAGRMQVRIERVISAEERAIWLRIAGNECH